MIEKGCLENICQMYTFHNSVLEPKGQIFLIPGYSLSASGSISINSKLFSNQDELKHGNIQDFCKCSENKKNYQKIKSLLENNQDPFDKNYYFDNAMSLLYLSKVITEIGKIYYFR